MFQIKAFSMLFMKPRSDYTYGHHITTVVDTRPGRAFETISVENKPSRTDSLYNIISVSSKTKPYKRPNIQRYSKSVQVQHNGRLIMIQNFSNGSVTTTDSGVVGPNALTTVIGDKTTAYNNAVSALAEAIRGGIDVSIDGFQYKQTVALARKLFNVRNHVKTIFDLIEKAARPSLSSLGSKERLKALRAYNRLKARRGSDYYLRTPLKEIGSVWLEFQYGLRPTMQTIFDIVNGEAVRVGNSLVIQHKDSEGRTIKHVKGRSKEERTQILRTTNSLRESKFVSSYLVCIGGSYTPSDHYIESLSRLSSLNPASIAWELIPFSFVFDWFLDVGGYLRALETSLLSNSFGKFNGFLTTVELHTTSEKYAQFGYADWLDGTFSGTSSATSYIVNKSRGLLASVPYPSPPVFRANLGSERLLNAAALLTNLLPKK